MTLTLSDIEGAVLFRHGKVRDVYEAGPDRLVLVASDRLSAFDVVLPTPIPDKGKVLDQPDEYRGLAPDVARDVAKTWREKLAGVLPE